ncbi:hypothetical protein NFI95_10265 [Acetobacteraceae bacterium KSS8]|uniref:Uncharacterized protein n=1 Tax=Endosaccharibacter trunci TaxID=2812733 RepID=A0ABT1W9P9_9PROT|nr:hypothetical protein [Acetobacteraceae bacterium KSS8]
MTKTERDQERAGESNRLMEEVRHLRSEEFAGKLASQWPVAFKITEIFFKYVSWLTIIVATKLVSDSTKEFVFRQASIF